MGGQRRWLWLSRRQRAFLVPFGGALVAGVMLGLLLASGFAFDSNAYKILRDAMVLLGSVLLTWFGWRRVKAADEQNRNQTRALDRQTDQIKLTRDQMELTRRDQLSKRFTEAVKQLGDDKLEIRMGGIAGLWAVATESTHPEDRIMVLDVLCAFVRNAPHPKEGEPQKIKPDVELAMKRLGSVGPYFPWGDVEEGKQPYRRDFSGAYLLHWKVCGGDFSESDFNDVYINYGVFISIKFSNCSIFLGNADSSCFYFCKLNGSKIDGASCVSFNECNFSGAEFMTIGGDKIHLSECYHYEGMEPFHPKVSGSVPMPLINVLAGKLQVRPAP